MYVCSEYILLAILECNWNKWYNNVKNGRN